jgi:hypothetical protein
MNTVQNPSPPQSTEQTPPSKIQPRDNVQSGLLPQKAADDARNLDVMSNGYAVALANTQGHMERAFLLATGIDRIRAALTDQVMGHFLKLMNSPLGFTTDRPGTKNPQPYDIDTVRDCLIASLLSGFYPVNNEWSIISGKFYGGKNGYIRKVAEITDLTDLDVVPSTPVLHEGRTVVRVMGTWKLKGVPGSLVDSSGKPGRVFSISQNAGSTDDNTIGKALRKAYKAIWDKINGSATSLPDMDEESTALTSAQPLPPVGRQSLKPPTNGAAKPAPALTDETLKQQAAKEVFDEKTGEVLSDKPIAAPAAEQKTAAASQLDEAAIQGLYSAYEDRIEMAETDGDTAVIDDELAADKVRLGDKFHRRLSERNGMRRMQITGAQRAEKPTGTVKRK